MTLVQNLQRQLSGNSTKLVLMLVIMFTLQSCSVFEGIFGKKKTPPPPDPQVHYPKDNDDPKDPEKDPDVVVIDPGTPVDTIKKDDAVTVFDEVNIAVMLPFGLAGLDNGAGYSSANRNGFELYKGIQLALEDLDVERLKLKVHVLDNAGTVMNTNELLNKAPFPNVDLVIGPLYKKNVQTIAPFAKLQKIPFISPLASDDLANDNPFVYSAVANDFSRYSAVINFIQKRFDDANVGLMYQPLSKEIRIKDNFLAVAKSQGLIIQEQVSEGRDMFSAVTNLLQKDRQNIVVVPADNNEEGQIYINSLLGYLEFIANQYDVKVMGLSEWDRIKSISPTKLETVNAYSINKYFINQGDAKSASKLDYLREKNRNQPLHTYTLQGYDIMSYVGNLIERHGTDFMKHFGKKEYAGLQTAFNFGEFEENGNIQFMDNKHINIVRYRANGWEKVN